MLLVSHPRNHCHHYQIQYHEDFPLCFLLRVYSFSQYHLLKRLVMIMCPYRFISCNQCTTLVAVVDNVRGYTRSRCGEYMGKLYLPLNFAVNLELL